MDEFIKLPSVKKSSEGNDTFEGKGVFQVLWRLKAPKLNHEQYINRNGFVSVQL